VDTHGRAVLGEYLPESTGAGCAFRRLRNDGLMEHITGEQRAVRLLTHPSRPLRNALLHNESGRHIHRHDGKAASWENGYGMGVAVGVYGIGGRFPDLYCIAVCRSILYHNNGDGTYRRDPACVLESRGMCVQRVVV